jgi:hypothetical protein
MTLFSENLSYLCDWCFRGLPDVPSQPANQNRQTPESHPGPAQIHARRTDIESGQGQTDESKYQQNK